MEQIQRKRTPRPVRLGVLTLKIDHQGNWVPVSQIVRVEGVVNYSRIYTQDGKSYLVAITLRKISERLVEFWRSHRKHLVNPVYVQQIRKSQKLGRVAFLTTGEQVPISRRMVTYPDLSKPIVSKPHFFDKWKI